MSSESNPQLENSESAEKSPQNPTLKALAEKSAIGLDLLTNSEEYSAKLVAHKDKYQELLAGNENFREKEITIETILDNSLRQEQKHELVCKLEINERRKLIGSRLDHDFKLRLSNLERLEASLSEKTENIETSESKSISTILFIEDSELCDKDNTYRMLSENKNSKLTLVFNSKLKKSKKDDFLNYLSKFSGRVEVVDSTISAADLKVNDKEKEEDSIKLLQELANLNINIKQAKTINNENFLTNSGDILTKVITRKKTETNKLVANQQNLEKIENDLQADLDNNLEGYAAIDNLLCLNQGEIAYNNALKFLNLNEDNNKKVILINDARDTKFHLAQFPEKYKNRIEIIDFKLDENELEKPEVILDLILKISALNIDVTKLGCAPGYGYISENINFWKIIEAYGVKNASGPNSRHIELVGDKTRATEVMNEVAVEMKEETGFIAIPQSTSINNNLENREEKEDEVFSFMWNDIDNNQGESFRFKADNLGGGRGQYVIRIKKNAEGGYTLIDENSKPFKTLIESVGKDEIEDSIRENVLAKNFYSDKAISGLFLQKNLEKTQHMELQFICDRDGLSLFVGGRNCSLQKMGVQKVIELALVDFPGNENAKKKLIETAKALFKKLEEKLGEPYVGLATVELLYDPKTERYYFLEINSRGQVEKFVTDMATQCDSDSSAYEVIQGKTLNLEMEDRVDKIATEVRLCFDKPANDFEEKAFKKTIISASIEPGEEISVQLDPRLLKMENIGLEIDGRTIKFSDLKESDFMKIKDQNSRDSMFGKIAIFDEPSKRKQTYQQLLQIFQEEWIKVSGINTNFDFVIRMLEDLISQDVSDNEVSVEYAKNPEKNYIKNYRLKKIIEKNPEDQLPVALKFPQELNKKEQDLYEKLLNDLAGESRIEAYKNSKDNLDNEIITQFFGKVKKVLKEGISGENIKELMINPSVESLDFINEFCEKLNLNPSNLVVNFKELKAAINNSQKIGKYINRMPQVLDDGREIPREYLDKFTGKNQAEVIPGITRGAFPDENALYRLVEDKKIKNIISLHYNIDEEPVRKISKKLAESDFKKINHEAINTQGYNADDYIQAGKYLYEKYGQGSDSFIHCDAGSDRTGLITAVMQYLAGFDRALIEKDAEIHGMIPEFAAQLKIILDKLEKQSLDEKFEITIHVNTSSNMLVDNLLNAYLLEKDVMADNVTFNAGSRILKLKNNEEKAKLRRFLSDNHSENKIPDDLIDEIFN